MMIINHKDGSCMCVLSVIRTKHIFTIKDVIPIYLLYYIIY